MVKNVLIFRSKCNDDKDDNYEKLLSNDGYNVKTISPIQFQYCNDSLLKEYLKNWTKYYGIIFTSKRAVDAVQFVLKDEQNLIEQWKKKKLYCEGPATAKLVNELFCAQSVGSETGTAEKLAEFIVKDVNRDEKFCLLFPCAEMRNDKLPERLTQANIAFDELTVYGTTISASLESELKDYLVEKKPDVLGFFSPSGFNNVYEISKKVGLDLENCCIVSIGDTTSKRVRCITNDKTIKEERCLKPTPVDFYETVKKMCGPV
ncbi:unnamed protein product [Didymodactylos carnosus]|nr:unnamed protein product [Didymodactylos carnosus]CAF3683076.1 unnamed protein product [Didymodactylos carnosus]